MSVRTTVFALGCEISHLLLSSADRESLSPCNWNFEIRHMHLSLLFYIGDVNYKLRLNKVRD